MRRFVAVCLKDLRQRIRDRTILLLGLAGPFVVASVVGLALGAGADFRADLVIADLDGSEASRRLVDVFTAPDGLADVVDVVQADPEESALDTVARHDAEAGIVVPAGFGAAAGAAGDDPVSVTVLVDPANPIEGSLAEGVVREYLGAVGTVRLAYAAAAATTPDPAGLASVPPPDPAASIGIEPEAVFQLRPIDYFAPSMGLMFLYFTVLFGAATFVREQRTHTLARLAASPTASGHVIGGKLAALFVIGIVEMAVLIVSTSLVYDVPWGEPVPLTLLVLTTVAAAIGLTGVVAGIARTEEQARSIGSAVILGLSFFGGQFFMAAGLPAIFRTIQAATPTGAALAGFNSLMIAGDTGTLATVWWPAAYTALFGLVTIGLGVLLFERRMHR